MSVPCSGCFCWLLLDVIGLVSNLRPLLNRFVTLDSSSSRDDMVRVMMELRTKNILGESVKARLKTASSTTTQSNTITSAPLLYSGDRNLVYQSTPTQIPSKNGIPKNKKSSHSKPPASPKKPKARREKSPKAQLLSSSQFPSLGDHDEKPLSDGASTATTTSTTSTVVVVESQPTAVFGYAAALLKPAPPPLPPKVTEKVSTNLHTGIVYHTTVCVI